MQHIIITIKSFDYIYINKSIKNIQKFCNLFRVTDIKYYSLPLKFRKYTVERSPHIDKKSREQFEIKKYKTNIQIKLKNTITVSLIQHIMKNSIYPGAEISFSLKFNDFWINEKEKRLK